MAAKNCVYCFLWVRRRTQPYSHHILVLAYYPNTFQRMHTHRSAFRNGTVSMLKKQKKQKHKNDLSLRKLWLNLVANQSIKLTWNSWQREGSISYVSPKLMIKWDIYIYMDRHLTNIQPHYLMWLWEITSSRFWR